MNYEDSRQLFDSESHLSNSQIFTFVAIVFIVAVESVRLEEFTDAIVQFNLFIQFDVRDLFVEARSHWS